MKQLSRPIVLTTILALLFFTVSCSKDDSNPEPEKEEVAEQPKQEPAEEPTEQPNEGGASSEASNKIAGEVIIKGSIKIEGEPPAPNGAITMDLSGAVKSGVPVEGFEIPLISEADIVGAYVQFKAPDAEISQIYYDVDIAKNQSGDDSSGKHRSYVGRLSSKSRDIPAKGTVGILDIDFAAELQSGEFCYIICVYDDAGNISAPQEVCVTVNAWGGNEALVGTWSYKRNEDVINGEVTESEIVGEEYCNEFSCQTIEYGTVIFNLDGTFEFTNRTIYREIDGTYGNRFEEYVQRGKWSYPAVEGSDLILVDYYTLDTDENGTREETYAEGDSTTGVVNSENIELTSNQLTVSSVYDYDIDGNGVITNYEYYEKQ